MKNLKPVGFVGLAGPVPLHQVVVRPVQLLVQFDHEAFEEGGELALVLAGRVLLAHRSLLVQQPALNLQLPARL